MQNTIRVQLSLSFRGETRHLGALIDLDACMREPGEAPDFHLLLARANGIDPYSYLYEVLESQELQFAEPKGLAACACREGGFDWARFERAWREERELALLRVIAERTLGVRDLDAQEGLKAALLAAYRAGREAGAV